MFTDLELWPRDSHVAEAIIVFLIVLFVVWLWRWLVLKSRIANALRELSSCEHASSSLVDEAVRQNREGASSPDAACDVALSSAGISLDGDIGKHVRTLFLSGWRDAALDIGELNRRTIEGVLGNESALRTFLSTFVIIGLLGTLLGIARAVAVFGGDEPSAQELLRRLPGAFTPSMWGVSFSIFGSLLLAWARKNAAEFSTALRATTIEVLSPQLVPSHSERIDHAATRAVAAAQRVVEFAEGMEVRTQELDGSLDRSTKYARAISQAMQKMSNGVESAGQLADKTLLDLTSRINLFAGALDRLSDFRESMDRHETSMVSVLQQLKEAAFDNARTSQEFLTFARTGTNDLLNATRELYKPVKDSADDIAKTSALFTGVCAKLTGDVAAVAKEQTGVLEAQFVSWRSELSEGANTAKRALDNLRVPFEQSADRLQEQAANAIIQMSTLIEALTERGQGLEGRLRDVVAPLSKLVPKDVALDGEPHPLREPAVVEISPGDWDRIEGMLRAPTNGGSHQLAEQAQFPPHKLEARFAALDTRLSSLDATLKDLALALRHERSPGWVNRIFKRRKRG